MHCRTAAKLISLRLDQAQPREVARALDEHLSACPYCRRYASGLEQLGGILVAPPEVAPPADFVASVMAQLTGRPAAEANRAPVGRFNAIRFVFAAALFAMVASFAIGTAFVISLVLPTEGPVSMVASLAAQFAASAGIALTLADLAAYLLPVLWPTEVSNAVANVAIAAAASVFIWAIATRRRVRRTA